MWLVICKNLLECKKFTNLCSEAKVEFLFLIDTWFKLFECCEIPNGFCDSRANDSHSIVTYFFAIWGHYFKSGWIFSNSSNISGFFLELKWCKLKAINRWLIDDRDRTCTQVIQEISEFIIKTVSIWIQELFSITPSNKI